MIYETLLNNITHHTSLMMGGGLLSAFSCESNDFIDSFIHNNIGSSNNNTATTEAAAAALPDDAAAQEAAPLYTRNL